MIRVFLTFVACVWAMGAAAQTLGTSTGPVRLEPMASGLDTPWGVAVLGDGAFLVTERGGRLLHFKDGKRTVVAGVPRVKAQGQGGLLDVTVGRSSVRPPYEVFLTFSKPQPGGGAGTALARGYLDASGRRLRDVQVLFEAAPGGKGGRHFGSRVVEGRNKELYVTIGDRGDRPSAQDRSNHNGSVVRIRRSGKPDPRNPFLNTPGVQPEIWSYGHRNPQGAVVNGRGDLWVVEHGAKGGDEINRVVKGGNFGWPVISYGTHYNGAKIGEGTAKPAMEQPRFYWDPSIAPSGMMIYSGRLWPEWQGDFFVGSLKFDYIARLSGLPIQEVEQIKGPETERIRDIIEAYDGSIWFIAEGSGTVWRMTPE
ncbi:MAG: PQQ-dependent sugar dehydrogenase [Silicimonas sp.]|nr:PQQ-dependent sugar dehydrogenase [Silicimonas sp.]